MYVTSSFCHVGITYSSLHYAYSIVTVNVPQYLAWLKSQLILLGGRLERAEFTSLDEVMLKYKNATAIVNCTGLGSIKLSDVQDTSMLPIRGQTVLVRAPHVKKQLCRIGKIMLFADCSLFHRRCR